MEGQREGMSAELREQSARAGEAVQQKAVELKNEGRQSLTQQLDERTTQVGGQARTFAETLRKSGRELESQQQNRPASKVAVGVADRLERVGGYLEQAQGDDLLRDVERFARERPWLVAGAAAAAGFAASRLLKASSERRYGSQGGNGSQDRSGWSDSTTSWRSSEQASTSAFDEAQVSGRATVVEPGR
jgi:hypothetical protein